MFSIASAGTASHPLDLILQKDFSGHQTLDLGIEEITETLHYLSDCASSALSLSTSGGCMGGCTSSAATAGSMGSVASTGANS
ncbi:hypothetical protein HGT70_14205 [Rosenbergiella collisarenosi]|uniref:hypothetical protein n=1 Tax=Rosenbergiella collisarenosi TaxID=1544695 RepID=UPI001BDAE85E|nr:hypothetical protein [Rosenbergiella collisarenosi]MBT0722427.1 hypothetical protein [Rosenbergiella collisarenosi]